MKPVQSSPGMDTATRRRFLQCAAAATLGGGMLQEAPLLASPGRVAPHADHCILINLVGGPSQLDTFDPKPGAPSSMRGPFRPAATNVPGIYISEMFPRLATMMHRVALVRSVFHDEAPIHETGQQLVQTGGLITSASGRPHIGALAGLLRPSPAGLPGLVVTPGPIRNTGVSISHGQDAGAAGRPLVYHDAAWTGAAGLGLALERYGDTLLGRGCLTARLLVEQGVRFVVVNMYDTVFDQLTWDCHADGCSLHTTLADVGRTVGPTFDRAFTALLGELDDRGLLASTLVVASGEFGRTPLINRRGGRDHWPGVWTALLAGGGVRGGQVLGRSDRQGAAPADRPVPAAALAATMLYALGATAGSGGPALGRASGLTGAAPILELF